MAIEELRPSTGCRDYHPQDSDAINRVVIFEGPPEFGFPKVALQFNREATSAYIYPVTEDVARDLESAANEPSRSLGQTFQQLGIRDDFSHKVVRGDLDEMVQLAGVQARRFETAVSSAPHLFGDPTDQRLVVSPAG